MVEHTLHTRGATSSNLVVGTISKRHRPRDAFCISRFRIRAGSSPSWIGWVAAAPAAGLVLVFAEPGVVEARGIVAFGQAIALTDSIVAAESLLRGPEARTRPDVCTRNDCKCRQQVEWPSDAISLYHARHS